jgi:hypothetical protein
MHRSETARILRLPQARVDGPGFVLDVAINIARFSPESAGVKRFFRVENFVQGRVSRQVKADISWRNGSRPIGPRARAWACHAFKSKAGPSRRRASWRASSQTFSPTL